MNSQGFLVLSCPKTSRDRSGHVGQKFKQVMNGTIVDHEWDAGVAKLLDEAFANG